MGRETDFEEFTSGTCSISRELRLDIGNPSRHLVSVRTAGNEIVLTELKSKNVQRWRGKKISLIRSRRAR